MRTQQEPVYTEKTECRDCYKCVRNCAVKAIGVIDNHATVIADRCLACGRCVEVCPAGAKRVRDDLGRARELVAGPEPVYLSLAPSFVSEFNGVDPVRLIHAIRTLGFAGVSETALGAEQISFEIARRLQTAETGIFISSACPSVVALLERYMPAIGRGVTDLASPVMAHCRLLRATYGKQIGIVFAGPCIAKKMEADSHPDLIDVAITFADLRAWLEANGGPLHGTCPDANDVFVPARAADGALYPVDGGMIESIRAAGYKGRADFIAISGIETIQRALEGLKPDKLDRPLFMELLACEGGCINGPRATTHSGTVVKRQAVNGYAVLGRPDDRGRMEAVDTSTALRFDAVTTGSHPAHRLREALREVGKYSSRDELNCGGCGYDNCRAFAGALLDGQAERSMCVSYMRKLAQTKANILMQTMPSGVVVVNERLEIVESNANFSRMLGGDAPAVFEARPGLSGAALDRMVPFHAVFKDILVSGESLIEKDVRLDARIFQLTVFSIEPHRLVGGIMRDVTEPVVQKERVVRKTREVMIKNLNTVQQIARLLGENAAESETILNSVIASFEPVAPSDTVSVTQGREASHGG